MKIISYILYVVGYFVVSKNDLLGWMQHLVWIKFYQQLDKVQIKLQWISMFAVPVEIDPWWNYLNIVFGKCLRKYSDSDTFINLLYES